MTTNGTHVRKMSKPIRPIVDNIQRDNDRRSESTKDRLIKSFIASPLFHLSTQILKTIMKIISYGVAAAAVLPQLSTAQQQQMVKMCLFYDQPSGHARSDPIINQECTSSHVHTFYGPRSFHPSTTYNDLITTPDFMNTSPYVENKSLYWHPSIYRVDSTGLHTRVDNLEFGPYYRWDKSVSPVVEPFPPGFRMIAASNDPGANGGDEEDGFVAMFTECCNFVGGEESCNGYWEGELFFPNRNCDFLGFALGE